MRRFKDDGGVEWVATVGAEGGGDYKGRFYLILRRAGSADGDALALADVRWNTRKTADRTLKTMSSSELRRRLHSARGRIATFA